MQWYNEQIKDNHNTRQQTQQDKQNKTDQTTRQTNTQQTQSHKPIQTIHNNTIHINISLMNTTHTTTITYQYITNHVSLTHTTNR